MRRQIIIATLAAVVGVPAWAQMRGGHAVSGRPAGVGHVPAAAGHMNGRGFGGSFHSGFSGGQFGRPGSFFHHHHHHFGYGRYYYPWAYAYYGGYWDYPLDYSSSYDNSYNQQLQAYQLQMMNQQQIEQRIDRLEDRLDQLLAQRSVPAPSQQPTRESKAEPARPAVLVYKDGHTQEIQNYAIIGQTLWIFSEQQAKKIPLSSLDLPATRKANEDRDIDFDVPSNG